MKPIRFVLVLICEILQWLIIIATLPFNFIERVGRITARLMIRWPYYGVVRTKRRLLGQPLWQEHDYKLGMPLPGQPAIKLVPFAIHMNEHGTIEVVQSTENKDAQDGLGK